MKAPFPYFGGKSRVAKYVWSRFGDVQNYVEPFCGSLAVLLARPTPAKTETVNDADCYLANFWRALRADPAEVARWADWPVSEVDLVARHRWLLQQADFRERMKTDPDYYDAKVAGWWVWGACAWIGGRWCSGWRRGHGYPPEQLPHLGNAGMGIDRKLPHLGDAGRGINRKLPYLGASRGQQIQAYFEELALRLRDTRIACGDWSRVLGPSVTFRHGVTAIFLDPPYGAGDMDYAAGGNRTDVAAAVREWAFTNGDNPLLRIALCGYEGEFSLPDGWTEYAWKTQGGYGARSNGQGRTNAARERIWFSPHCLPVEAEVLPLEVSA